MLLSTSPTTSSPSVTALLFDTRHTRDICPVPSHCGNSLHTQRPWHEDAEYAEGYALCQEMPAWQYAMLTESAEVGKVLEWLFNLEIITPKDRLWLGFAFM